MDLEFLSVNSIILILSSLFIILYLLSGRKRYTNMPPGPSGLPIFGNLLTLCKDGGKIHEILEKMAAPYGKVMLVKLGTQNAIVLTGYDVMKEAMIDKAESFSERPVWLETVTGLNRQSGTALNPDWQNRRRFTLVSMRDFGLGKKSLEEKMQEEAAYLTQAIRDTEGQPFDLFTLTPYTTANIICSIIIGYRFPYGDAELKGLLDTFTLIARGTGNLSPQNFLPFLRYFPSADFKSTAKGVNGLHAIAEKWTKQHEESFDPDNIRDLIDLFIQEKRKNPDSFGKWDLMNTIAELFIAGTETTSTTLCWAILYMINFPEAQERCRQVIHSVLGPDKVPVYDDIKKLPYINAVINEVQRLANLAPLGLWHSTLHEVQLAGYTIPKDTIVLPNIQTALRDPKYWRDPDTFNPERWLSDDKEKIVKNPAFIPFFTGKRACLGEQLAKKELFIFFTTMLQRFRFTMADGARPTLAATVGLIQSPLPFKVQATAL